MGTWGPGNLDSDGALDAVAEHSSGLIGRVWSRLRDTTSAEADEWDHDALFVDLEMLFALADHGVFNGWDLPRATDLDPVTRRWLAHWEDYFDGLAPREGFKAERRGVIEASFARLRGLCAANDEARGRG